FTKELKMPSLDPALCSIPPLSFARLTRMESLRASQSQKSSSGQTLRMIECYTNSEPQRVAISRKLDRRSQFSSSMGPFTLSQATRRLARRKHLVASVREQKVSYSLCCCCARTKRQPSRIRLHICKGANNMRA